MPSPFDAFDAAMQADVDLLFGEGIRIVPTLGDDPNYTGGPDPHRPIRNGVRATVARAPSASPTVYSGSRRNGTQLSAMPAELWIDQVAYAAIGYEVARGDIIVLTDDADAPSHTVAAVHKGDNGDAKIILG